MQEFSAISVSSYEAGSLADRLTEQSRDGWSVVAVVPTGNTVTAYLCRDGSGEATAATAEPVLAETEHEPTADTEPVLAAAAGVTAAADEPVDEPAAEPAVEATPATDTATTDTATAETTATDTATTDTATAEATATDTAATTAGAAPAGWYADPSGRFELRYWDGGQWTEHVSRAGQQYTDPPVA